MNMDVQPTENFFELKLSQEGSARILRIFRLVKRMFVVAILWSMVLIAYSIFRIYHINRFDSLKDWQFQAELIATPVYVLVVTAFLLFQLYSYFHFARLCKRAIELQQADLFNYSFKWLARHALFSFIILVTEFLMSCFSFYVAIHLVMKYPTP